MKLFSRIIEALWKPSPKISSSSSSKSSGKIVYKETYRSDELQKLGLELSTQIRTYSEEEVRAKAKVELPLFETAFWKVAGTVQAEKATLESLIPSLSVAFQSRDTRRQLVAVMSSLREGQWQWSAYELQVGRQRDEGYAAEMNEIKMMNVIDLLCAESKEDLKERYAFLTGEKIGANRFKKEELAQAIIRQASSVQLGQIESELRTALLDGVGADDEPLSNRDMCEAFVSEVQAIFYALKHAESAREIKADRPYWCWQTVTDRNTCSFCARLNGKVFRHDDPIWSKLLDRPHIGCRCSFRAYNDEDLHAKGLKVIHSSGLILEAAI